MLQLRPYQEEAVKAVRECGLSRPLVALPTGTGKTIVFCQVLKERGGRALILAHRDELLQQAEEKLRLVWPEIPSLGVVKAERNEKDAQVVLGSVQTLRGPRLGALSDFDTVIVDEAHHNAAASYQRIHEHLQAPLTIGFTATPERADSKPLGFDKIVYSKSFYEMIAAQYLCDVKAKQIQLKKLDLSQVKKLGGDWEEESLSKALEAADAPEHVAEALGKWAAERPTLVFTPTVQMAMKVRDALGTGFEVVHGEQNLGDRRLLLQHFRDGKLRGLVNCGVLLEGYDEPRVACVAIVRPTRSRVLYQQMIGRGTRLAPGKEDLLILDFVGATIEHDLVTLASLLHITEATAEQGVEAALQQAKAALKEKGVAEGELVAATVNLMTRERLHWIEDGARWLLPAGDETLALVKDGEFWAVRALQRGAGKSSVKLYGGLTLEYAQGAAEDYIRRAGVEVLAGSGARWRSMPASQAQLDRMKEYRIPFKPGITKGEASDAMTRYFNRRKW